MLESIRGAVGRRNQICTFPDRRASRHVNQVSENMRASCDRSELKAQKENKLVGDVCGCEDCPLAARERHEQQRHLGPRPPRWMGDHRACGCERGRLVQIHECTGLDEEFESNGGRGPTSTCRRARSPKRQRRQQASASARRIRLRIKLDQENWISRAKLTSCSVVARLEEAANGRWKLGERECGRAREVRLRLRPRERWIL